jgi:SagB-type dehydrogenase family enzyme
LLSQNRLVAEDYLLNFRRSEADLGIVIGANNYSNPMVVGSLANRGLEENEENLIDLPPYENVRAPVSAIIRSRRSIRRYSGKSFSLNDLSTLLYHAAGVSGHLHSDIVTESVTLGKSDQIELRAATSGGALYPIDLFIVPINVTGLDANQAYCYRPRHHALRPEERSATRPDLSQFAQFGEIQVDKAGFLIGYVYKLFENARKYGDAALAFALIETGGIAAHIHLLCTALGFGSCDVGSFSKRRFERLFGADGISQHMVHLTVVGK